MHRRRNGGGGKTCPHLIISETGSTWVCYSVPESPMSRSCYLLGQWESLGNTTMSAYLDKKVIVRWRHVVIKSCVLQRNQYSSIIYISRVLSTFTMSSRPSKEAQNRFQYSYMDLSETSRLQWIIILEKISAAEEIKYILEICHMI